MAGSLHTSIGALLLGVFFNVFLLGFFWVQVYIYFVAHRLHKEPPWTRIVVFVVFALDNFNSALDMSMIYSYTINNFGNYGSLASPNWMLAINPIPTGIIASIVQFFFAWRIMALTRQKWLAALVIILSVVSTVSGFIAVVLAEAGKTQFSNLQILTPVISVWLVGTALTDILITVSLVLHLHRHRRGFQATDNIISRLIRLTVPTGMVTAVVAVLDLILFLTSDTEIHFIFNLPLAKLYTNCLMSSLNARTFWRIQVEPNSASRSIESSAWSFKLRSDRGVHWPRNPPRTQVQVATTHEVHQDGAESYEMESTKVHTCRDDIVADVSQDAMAQPMGCMKTSGTHVPADEETGDV